MLRFKTTTPEGKVFLSPFVYDLDTVQTNRKLMRFKKLVRKSKIEPVEVSEYPVDAIYHWGLKTLDITEFVKKVKLTESLWEDLNNDNGEDFEEMEEGSA